MTLATFSLSGALDDITIGYAGLRRCSISRCRLTYEEFMAGLSALAGRLLVPDRDLWFRPTLYVTQGHWGEEASATSSSRPSPSRKMTQTRCGSA